MNTNTDTMMPMAFVCEFAADMNLVRWMGRPVEELSRDELLQVIRSQMLIQLQDRERHAKQLEQMAGIR